VLGSVHETTTAALDEAIPGFAASGHV
jgi:hypothetical protein